MLSEPEQVIPAEMAADAGAPHDTIVELEVTSGVRLPPEALVTVKGKDGAIRVVGVDYTVVLNAALAEIRKLSDRVAVLEGSV